MIKIGETGAHYVKEPLLNPFGFKGKYINEAWQVAGLLKDEGVQYGVGLGVQSVLWSDSQVFSTHGESGGNSIMYKMTEYALGLAQGLTFNTPIDLLDQLLPDVYAYGRRISGNDGLRTTFALNALVALDNAAWMLYSRSMGIDNFDEMIPGIYAGALPCRHEKLASIPLFTYDIKKDDIRKYLDEGYFFLKIKIGSDPDKDGDLDKMLEWDKQRLSEIHEIARDRETPYTENRRIPYYLDANGRYDNKERLFRFLDHADRIGALDRIILLEEPFPEEYLEDVRDIPVRLAADESAHSDIEALERIQTGYGAIALKPVAKTMSMSLKVLKVAYDNKIPCFCADLTVNPVMVDWNKNVASRLNLLPGMRIGVLESNGHQNYTHWEKMKSYHPFYGASWIETKDGVFNLDADFYKYSGGIFRESDYYSSLLIHNSIL